MLPLSMAALTGNDEWPRRKLSSELLPQQPHAILSSEREDEDDCTPLNLSFWPCFLGRSEAKWQRALTLTIGFGPKMHSAGGRCYLRQYFKNQYLGSTITCGLY